MRRPAVVPAHCGSGTSYILIACRALGVSLLAAKDVPKGRLRRADLPPPLLGGRRQVGVGRRRCWGLAFRWRRGPALGVGLLLLPGLDAGAEVLESLF